MSTAGNGQTIGSASTLRIFKSDEDGGKCRRFFVGCRSTSANVVKVNVAGIHTDGEFVGLPPGTAIEFERVVPLDDVRVDGDDGITEVIVQGVGGDAVIDFGIVSKTVVPAEHIRSIV